MENLSALLDRVVGAVVAFLLFSLGTWISLSPEQQELIAPLPVRCAIVTALCACGITLGAEEVEMSWEAECVVTFAVSFTLLSIFYIAVDVTAGTSDRDVVGEISLNLMLITAAALHGGVHFARIFCAGIAWAKRSRTPDRST